MFQAANMKRAIALIDLSGTLHIDDAAITGAATALQRLRKLMPVRFVTNTTKECISDLHSRLLTCGFDVHKEEMYTSLLAARRLIEREKLRPMLLLEHSALDDFTGISTSDANAVVVGLAPSHFHHERVNEAFRLLIQGRSRLIAIHKAKYYKTNDGLSIGPGAFVTALEYSTGVQAEVVGKPSPSFFQLALSDCDSSPEDAIMIGDDVSDDVQGAIDAGMKAILVRTGKYRPGDEQQIAECRRNCVDSFVEAVDLIEKGDVR